MSLSKDLSERLQYISCGGLLNVGEEPNANKVGKFTGGKGLVYRIGHRCVRNVFCIDTHLFIEAECSVLRSTLSGVPLFQCTYKLDSTSELCSITTKNPTEVANKVVKKLTGSKHKWSGNDFFGFRRNDVIQKITNGNNNSNSVKIGWLGVKSFGIPILLDQYKYTSGNSSYRLQPGFEIIRSITINSVRNFNVHCQIVKTDQGPRFKCFSEDLQHVTALALKPTVAMKEIFDKLSIPKTRNRSGYEFFGFNRSEVLNVIKEPIISHQDPIITHTAALDKLQKIHDRNAGPTSSLVHKKSRYARNEAIHDAVKFGSFNDIESMFNLLKHFYIFSFLYFCENLKS